MLSSGIDNQTDVFSHKAYGYILANNRLQVAPYLNSSGAFSAGAIYSTTEDLLKWCRSLIDETLLSHQSIVQMTTPKSSNYGFGFGVLNFKNNGKSLKIFGHEGGIFGFRSLIHILPDEKAFIIILDNHNNSNLFDLSKEIIELI